LICYVHFCHSCDGYFLRLASVTLQLACEALAGDQMLGSSARLRGGAKDRHQAELFGEFGQWAAILVWLACRLGTHIFRSSCNCWATNLTFLNSLPKLLLSSSSRYPALS
jgi:hypothetical protein